MGTAAEPGVPGRTAPTDRPSRGCAAVLRRRAFACLLGLTACALGTDMASAQDTTPVPATALHLDGSAGDPVIACSETVPGRGSGPCGEAEQGRIPATAAVTAAADGSGVLALQPASYLPAYSLSVLRTATGALALSCPGTRRGKASYGPFTLAGGPTIFSGSEPLTNGTLTATLDLTLTLPGGGLTQVAADSPSAVAPAPVAPGSTAVPTAAASGAVVTPILVRPAAAAGTSPALLALGALALALVGSGVVLGARAVRGGPRTPPLEGTVATVEGGQGVDPGPRSLEGTVATVEGGQGVDRGGLAAAVSAPFPASFAVPASPAPPSPAPAPGGGAPADPVFGGAADPSTATVGPSQQQQMQELQQQTAEQLRQAAAESAAQGAQRDAATSPLRDLTP